LIKWPRRRDWSITILFWFSTLVTVKLIKTKAIRLTPSPSNLLLAAIPQAGITLVNFILLNSGKKNSFFPAK